MTQVLNKIPALTWNKLKVNFAEKQLFTADGDIAVFSGAVKNIPSAVTVLNEYDKVFDDIETGVGQAITDFVGSYSNEKNYLVIDKKSELKFEYGFDKDNSVLIDDNKFYIKADTEVVITQKYSSNDDTVGKHSGQTKVYLEKNARLKLIQVQLLNDKTEHFSDLGLYLEKNAAVTVIRIDLGAKDIVSGSLAVLEEKGSSFEIDSLYYGDSEKTLDFNDIARHIGEKTNSVIKAKGALFDSSKKTYRGTIDFHKGSKKSSGDESENTMVFSPKCINKSAPLILCGEDDVEGHHAASIGRIDEGLMFYMQTRGFSREQIRQMMIESSFAPTVSRIPYEDLQKEIFEYKNIHA